jgi:hypothetical protein
MEGMVTAVTQTWRAAEERGYTLDLAVVISLACYLVNGHTIPAHLESGCYARLGALTDNLTAFTTEQISQALGRPIYVQLAHDATAAALAYTGWEQTAVITLGTSLGIGFPPA